MTREEAIRRIKAWNLDADDMEVLSEVIPELKENEDERIRKWLYDYISNCPNNNFEFYGGVGKDAVLNYLEKQKEQKPIEWSEEDEAMYARIVRRYTDYEGVIMRTKEESVANKILDSMAQEEIWLKSTRPQPRKEIYQAAKHDLAIRFMNYLDENRPEGKMSLSNEHCEDIDKAFKENDWTKIIGYAKIMGHTRKYQIQSKQEWSEEEKRG